MGKPRIRPIEVVSAEVDRVDRADGAVYRTRLARRHSVEMAVETDPLRRSILNIPLTSFSAFDLLMSSLTMVLALAGIQRGNMKAARLWLAVTASLGMIFVGLQAYEFTHFVHEGLTLQKNLFACTFYVLTGFHGTHVTVGVIWLWTLFFSTFTGRIGPKNDLDVEICGLYWHFVDVVWIAIFTLIYLLQ